MKDNNLKLKAKLILSKKTNFMSEKFKDLDLNELLHEIDVYNAELEAQNVELLEKELMLKESLSFNQSIFDEAPFAYFCLDENLNILKANNMAYSNFSIPITNSQYNTFYKFIGKGYLGTFMNWLQSEEFRIKPLEINLISHNKIKRFRIFLKRLDTYDGYYLLNLLDIQEEYILKKMTEENNKILYEIAEYQSDMLVTYDTSFNMKFVNRSFLRFYDVVDIKEFIFRYNYISSTFIRKENFFFYEASDNTHWIVNIDNLDDSKRVVCIYDKMDKSEKFFMVNISKTLNEEYICTFSEITKYSLQSEEFREKSYKDELTKIYNRAKFNEFLVHEFSYFVRGKINLSMIMFDIDLFKNINDSYGHDVGDKILIELSQLIGNYIRKADVFARWGGEEFCLLLKGCNIHQSLGLAEYIRKKIQANIFSNKIQLTCSFGVADARKNDTIETFIKRADLALYKAKDSGRNCVES